MTFRRKGQAFPTEGDAGSDARLRMRAALAPIGSAASSGRRACRAATVIQGADTAGVPVDVSTCFR